MRFSDNRYYIEAYVKCSNCGVLIYDESAIDGVDGGELFCSDWCKKWAALRAAGDSRRVLRLPRQDRP